MDECKPLGGGGGGESLEPAEGSALSLLRGNAAALSGRGDPDEQEDID